MGTGRRSVWVAAFGAALSLVFTPAVARAAPGELDPTFGTGGIVLTGIAPSSADFATAAAIYPDGTIAAAGGTLAHDNGDFVIARYTRAGSLDASFGTGGIVLTGLGAGSTESANAVAVAPDGKLVAAGLTDAGPPGLKFGLARYNRDGSLDTRFGSGGIVLTSGVFSPNAVAFQHDGKIVAAGGTGFAFDNDFALVRYNRDGSLDASFGTGGIVRTNFGFSFGFPTIDEVFAVAIQPDGKIVAAGVSGWGGGSDLALARYNRDGSLDESFGQGGIVLTLHVPNVFGHFRALALAPGGGIVCAGASFAGVSNDFVAVRYHRDGSLDRSFGSGGIVVTDLGASVDDFARGLALRPGGDVVLAGDSFASEDDDVALVRYNRDGSLDGTFGNGGIVLTDLGSSSLDAANALVVQPSGDLVVVGSSSPAKSIDVDFALARYKGR